MTKQYWHDNITDKSYQALLELRDKFHFILIGGWAVYLWTKKMKSKDIDIVIDYNELGKLKEKHQVIKNERLKKYEIKLGEFDIDIYLPHYSKIGFPLEKISGCAQNIEGFIVPKIEVLLLLKLFAYQDRKNSIKGEKDKIDIISMLDAVDIDWKFFKKLSQEYKITNLYNEIEEILTKASKAEELKINNQQMAKLRKNILENIS